MIGRTSLIRFQSLEKVKATMQDRTPISSDKAWWSSSACRKRAILVVNTQSRRGESDYAEAKKQVTEAGITLDATYPVRHPERLQEIVRGAIAANHKFIIVGGGDGTISAVVDDFAFKDVIFGLLPLGTANSFARTLEIPVKLQGAVDILANGKVHEIDLGKINDDFFANGASIGLPVAVGRAATPRLKRWLGRVGYLLVAIYKFASHRPFQCELTVNGEEKSFRAFDIRIASGRYQGGVLMAEETRPDDGKILLHVLKGPSKWAIAREWGRATFHLPFPASDIEVLKAAELNIATIPKQDVAIDGEVLTQTPIRVSVARKALRIIVPQTF